MTAHALAALALLALPAFVPTVAMVGLRPVTFFLFPLVGALLAAGSAELELAVGGALVGWFVALAVLANGAALIRLQRTGALRGARWPSVWSCLTVVAVAGALVWPLQPLRAPMIAYDGYAIWTLHSVFIYGGHDIFLSALRNRAYVFSNPDYPPLVPASGALAFVSEGRVDLWLAVIVTAVLNACALGVTACGIVEAVGRRGRAPAKVAAVAAGVAVCLIGFGLGGVYAVGGYADLLWAAAASAAIVFGLVLPRAPRQLAVAWICATVAGLTKNEGLTTALVILVLIAIRYVPAPSRPSRTSRPVPADGDPATVAATAGPWARSLPSSTWVRRGAFAGAMALPALIWAALVRLDGIGNNFFGAARSQPIGQRLHPIATGLWTYLHILPLAAAVAVAGALALRRARARNGLGNDLWLWVVVVASLTAVTATYLFGDRDIHWWLSTSVDRTTIFARLALYTALAIWLLVAVTGALGARRLDARAGPVDRARPPGPPAMSVPTGEQEAIARR